SWMLPWRNSSTSTHSSSCVIWIASMVAEPRSTSLSSNSNSSISAHPKCMTKPSIFSMATETSTKKPSAISLPNASNKPPTSSLRMPKPHATGRFMATSPSKWPHCWSSTNQTSKNCQRKCTCRQSKCTRSTQNSSVYHRSTDTNSPQKSTHSTNPNPSNHPCAKTP